jgi:hypothetical protein
MTCSFVTLSSLNPIVCGLQWQVTRQDKVTRRVHLAEVAVDAGCQELDPSGALGGQDFGQLRESSNVCDHHGSRALGNRWYQRLVSFIQASVRLEWCRLGCVFTEGVPAPLHCLLEVAPHTQSMRVVAAARTHHLAISSISSLSR